MKRRSTVTIKPIAASILLLMSGMAGAQTANDGSAITAAELTQDGYTFPTDLVAGADQTQLANYAWRLFIAATQQTTATLTNGAGRGEPSATTNFIDSGNANSFSSPLVFESFYHRTEAVPFYTTTPPPSPIGTVPTYYTYFGDDNPLTVTGANYVNLDETNEISQNSLYYTLSNTPDFPVLFMAKVNATEANYFRQQTQRPSADYSYVFPDNVMEVKTAWRRVSDITGSDPSKYHQATATYYVGGTDSVAPTVVSDTFALVSIHIIQKTANYQEFIFTTFEHVDAVTRNAEGTIVDPAYQLAYNVLAYDTAEPPAHTASSLGAYTVNAPGQPAATNSVTTYTLPAAGTVSQSNTTVVQPQTIISEVNDVNNAVGALITGLSPNNVWANYRLKGVQAVPTNDEESPNFFLANIAVESSQPGIQLFKGTLVNGGVPVQSGNNLVFTNNRLDNNVSTGLVEGMPVPTPTFNVGGCQGCHGNAQQAGRDFSFLAQGTTGVGKEVDSVPEPTASPAEKAAHNARMAASSNFND